MPASTKSQKYRVTFNSIANRYHPWEGGGLVCYSDQRDISHCCARNHLARAYLEAAPPDTTPAGLGASNDLEVLCRDPRRGVRAMQSHGCLAQPAPAGIRRYRAQDQ